MDRRALLKAIGGSATVGLAGCLTRRSSKEPEQSNGTEPDAEDNDTSTEGNDTATATAGGGPTLTNRSFEVVSAECGTGENKSSASFETKRARVSGTIPGSDSCYTAKLKRVVCKENTLTVSVQSVKRENDTPCSMCVTDIKYEAVFDFKNSLPQRIVVLHNDTEVLNESRE